MSGTKQYVDLDEFADETTRITRALLREYRIRDRDEVFCYGVTVLQWETMDALGRLGEATMNEISSAMSLANSTMTRVVDQLVEKGLVERQVDPDDRRVVRIALTESGEEKLAQVRDCVRDAQKAVLAHIPPENRETILWALRQLWEARERYQNSCCSQ